MKKLYFLLFLTGITYAADSVNQSATDEQLSHPTRLKEFGATGLYDGSLEVTGKVQADRYFEYRSSGTPSTPVTKHARSYLDETNKRVCTIFDDGTVSCTSSGGSSLLTGVTAGVGLSGGGNSGNVTINLVTPISALNLSTDVPHLDIPSTFISSITITDPNGLKTTYEINGGSFTARNIASGVQCVHADANGHFTGTGSDCLTLVSTQTFSGGNKFLSYTNFVGTTTIHGSTDGSNAAAGDDGEYLVSTVGATALGASGAYANLTNISLTAGDWDVSGIVIFEAGTVTGTTYSNPNLMYIGTSSTQADETVALNDNFTDASIPSSASFGSTIAGVRISVNTTTTCYIAGKANYSGSTPNAFASIHARRIR